VNLHENLSGAFNKTYKLIQRLIHWTHSWQLSKLGSFACTFGSD